MDATGRVIETVNVDDSTTYTEYLPFRTISTDEERNIKEIVVDGKKRTRKVVYYNESGTADDIIYNYDYTTLDSLKTFKDPEYTDDPDNPHKAKELFYDTLNRRYKMVDPSVGTKLYEYYDATKYNTRYIIPLRNQLLTHLVTLQKLKTLSEFQAFLDEKVFGKEFLLALVRMDKTWMDHWTQYHEKIIKINQELLDLVDICIDEDHNLYVIGY